MAVDALSPFRGRSGRQLQNEKRIRRGESESGAGSAREKSAPPKIRSDGVQNRGSQRSERAQDDNITYSRRNGRLKRESREKGATADAPPGGTTQDAPQEGATEVLSPTAGSIPQVSASPVDSTPLPPPAALGSYSQSPPRRERIQLEIARAAGLIKETPPTASATTSPSETTSSSPPEKSEYRGSSIQEQLLINGAAFQTGSREKRSNQEPINEVDLVLKDVLSTGGTGVGSEFQSSAQELSQQSDELGLASLQSLKLIA